MKEIKFEISIPNFFQAKKSRERIRLVLSIIWIIVVFFIASVYIIDYVEIAILTYFGISIIWKLSSLISAFLALLFLVSEPFLLFMKNDTLAETFAIYVFYFLAITVVQEIVYLKKGSKEGA